MEKWALVQPLVEQLAPLRDLRLLHVLSLIIVAYGTPKVPKYELYVKRGVNGSPRMIYITPIFVIYVFRSKYDDIHLLTWRPDLSRGANMSGINISEWKIRHMLSCKAPKILLAPS